MAAEQKEAIERNTTCWDKVEQYVEPRQPCEVIKDRRGWKTVRIFVSSTFKDFHSERDLLVKKVFPDLRKWCQKRKLHLVECDLRWGAPKHFHSEQTLKMCLEEIDRCYKENNQPFFINMTSQRIGWIPKPKEAKAEDNINPDILVRYNLVFGLSITEMEIFHGAYKIENPNAMFLVRTDSFYKSLPTGDDDSSKKALLDYGYDDFAEQKLVILRRKLNQRFKNSNNKDNFLNYSARFRDFNDEGRVVLELDDEDDIMKKMINFFQEKIGYKYPPPVEISDKFKDRQLAHEAFMELKEENVFGRDDILKQIEKYIHSDKSDVPLLVLGGPGTGKSSIMARAAHSACRPVQASSKEVHVFYHFVGAVPGSTDLLTMLQRLLKELTNMEEEELPSDLDSAIHTTYSMLTHPGTKPVIIFIDALNQFDDDHLSVSLMNWVPLKLQNKVKCVFSLIPDTPQHRNIQARNKKATQLLVKDLQKKEKKMIVVNFFKHWTKELDDRQMNAFLDKKCSKNPLWLTIACEELRVHGNFRTMDNLKKFTELADDLLKLIEQVLGRFEKESGDSGKAFLKATLCLIEVSRRGLLESELFYILGDSEVLAETREQEKGQNEKREKQRFTDEDRLPAYKWNMMTRALGPFLRPFGDLGEGRLDFYHRAVSKAVRNKYLIKEGDEKITEFNYHWWHSKLADYFQLCEHAKADDALDRLIEEYPYHLVQIKDHKRLEAFLDDWKAFDKLYDRDHSLALLHYWKECADYSKMAGCYAAKLKTLPQADPVRKMKKYEQVGRVLLQSGEYDDAVKIARTGLDMAERSSAVDKSTLAGYFTLLSDISDTKYKQAPQLSADNVPITYEALKYSQKSVELLKELAHTDHYHKKLYGMYLTRHALNHSSLSDNLKFLTKPEEATKERFTPETAREKGMEYIDQAIQLFEEMQEKGLLAEAKLTKGNLYRRKFEQQFKWLKEAQELCKEAYGECHILMGRITSNLGNAYAERAVKDDFKVARDNYIKSYDIYWEIYGPEHPKSKAAIAIIDHTFYVSIFGKYEKKQ